MEPLRGRARGLTWSGVVAVCAVLALLSAGFAVAEVPAAGREGLSQAGSRVPFAGTSAYDWPELHENSGLSGYAANSSLSTADAANLGVAWATNLYAAALDSPVVAYDPTLGETLAYAGSENGAVVAVNVANGQIVWGNWLGTAVRSTPLVSDGSVYVATFTTPAIFNLNASTGAVECSIISPDSIEGTPTLATPPGGVRTLFIAGQGSSSHDGPLMAVNAATCALEWEFTGYHLPGTGSWDSLSYTLNATGVPVVLLGSDNPDSSVYAINAFTGQELWRFQTYNPGNADFDVAAGPVISAPGVNGFAHGVVYVPNKDGRFYALDLTTGTLIWQTNFNALAGVGGVSRSTAALDGTTLVFGYHAGLFALNALNGAELWDYKDPSRTEAVSSPAIAGSTGQEVVVAGDIGGSIDVVSLATGAPLYRYQTGGYITASPAISDGNILIASSDGFLYDLAVGGGNDATLPTTTLSSPSDSSTLINPNGNLPVTGMARDAKGVAEVEVAVQSGGPTGPWWDPATDTWLPGPVDGLATLATPGGTSTAWNFSYPVPTSGGTFDVTAYSVSAAGQSDIIGAHSAFIVLYGTSGPNLQTSPAFVAPGASVIVTGGGFSGSESVVLRLEGTTLATLSATAGVLPKTKLTIPPAAQFGLTALVATGKTSGLSATAPITVGNSWAQFGADSEHAGFEPNDTILNYLISFNRKWVHLAWHFEAGAKVNASPVVVDGVAYVGDAAGQLFAVDAHNGGLIWTYTLTSGSAIDGSPAVDPSAGLVLVASTSGTVAAISTSSGALVWSSPVGGRLSAPTMAGGEVYVSSSSGTVEALAEASGARTWSESLGSAVTGAPALDPAAHALVVGEADGQVAELNAVSGATIWTFAAGGALDAAASIAAKTVYVGATDGQVYALSESTGKLLWSYTTGGAVIDTGAYTNMGTGGSPELLIGSGDGNLYVLGAASGSLAYKIAYHSPIAGVAAADGVVVIDTASGDVSGARTFVNAELWVYKASAPFDGTPVIVDGAIYVAASDGNLYAFTPYGEPPD